MKAKSKAVIKNRAGINKNKQKDEVLRERDKLYRATLDNMLEGCQIIGHDWRYLYLNSAAEVNNRRPNQELLGNKYMDVWTGIESTHVFAVIKRCMEERVASRLENKFVYPDGAIGWFDLSIQPVPEGVFILSIDVTERKQAEKQIVQMNRLYTTLSQVNQTVVHAKDQDELYRSICDIAVKFGEFSLAWVGLLDEASGDVRPVTANGLEITQWPFPTINIHRGALKDGLTAIAIRTSKVVTSENIQTDKRLQNTYNQIEEYTYHSSAVIPFRSRGKTMGIVSLVSPEIGFFKAEEEIHLLEEMGLDISFALDNMEVEQTQAYLAAIVESSNDAILTKDLNGIITSWNKGAEGIFGYTADEIIGQSIQRLIPPERVEEEEQILNRIKQDQPVRHFETARLGKDGKQIEVSLTVSPVKNSTGKLVGTSKIMRDITERKQVEEQIRNLAKFPDENPFPVLRINGNGIILYANQASQPILEEWKSAIGQKAPAFWLKKVDEALTIRSQQDVDVTISDRIFSFIITPVFSEGYVNLYGRDITERKRAEENLRESEERFRSTFEQAAVGIAHISIEGKFLRINQRFCNMVGYTQEEMLALTFQDITHPDDLETDLRFVRQVLADEIKTYSIEKRYIRKDHSIIWINLTMSLVRDESGVPRNFISVVEDITKRRQAEEEVQKLNTTLEQRVIERTAQLAAINKELEAFSYSVSHDLRAPLRGIDGWSQALLEDYGAQLDEQAHQYLDRVRSETQWMGSLIDDLLELSRITRADMNKVQVDLSAITRTIASRLKEGESQRQIEFAIQSNLSAWGDPRLLEVVLTNLLNNAFKFTGKIPQARIEFGQTEMDGQHAFFVRDNGAGFDMAFAKKLFSPFQRMHKASEFPGTGVGLATVQRIVHRHGGRIWAESVVDAGATFYFTLEVNK